MKLHLAISLLILPAALFAQSDVPMAKPEDVGMSSKRLERIHAFIQDYIDTNQIAGAVTLVARKGKVVHFEAQGWRYKEENLPMPKDAIFSLASMTKPIVSSALMMLWEDGKFMLDDPISKWLPSYAKKDVLDPQTSQRTPARAITVRHVLTHTSGLSLETGGQRPKTLLEEIERSANRPLAFQPGDRWQYGASTDFVAALVEKISGMTVDEFLKQRIFEPLGIRDTHYNVPKEKVDRVAAIYRPDKDGKITLMRKPEYHEPTAYFPGVAGLNGTAADYFRFSQMLLNGGEYAGHRLLGRMTVDMMISNQIGTGKPVYIRGNGYGFGLGFGILTDPSKSPDALSIGTFTWGGANGTLFWIDPLEDLIGIMMIQINPYSHFNIRPLYSVVVSQAITDSLAGQKPRIMGYDTPR
ncbi:MAG TPA: serine hydrolase domain-containing protein [Bryobacteraceae bacterium]|jgi:CubicO group peptidase (beta-lactamase class C family)|nr:serine hydrolase domain-containing protein [Bryobacteraceae bacterium]